MHSVVLVLIFVVLVLQVKVSSEVKEFVSRHGDMFCLMHAKYHTENNQIARQIYDNYHIEYSVYHCSSSFLFVANSLHTILTHFL